MSDMGQLKARGPQTDIERMRIEIFDKVNALGIGAQGLGGLSTILDVKIMDAPCHAAGKPVAMIPNCAATRHAHFTLDGSGPSYIPVPDLDAWPKVEWTPDSAAKKVDLDHLTPEEVQGWKAGDRLLLNGAMLTGRDAAHKRIQEMLKNGEELPVSFKGRAIYYVGPVDPVLGEVVGPAGPTTATRMDKFTDMEVEGYVSTTPGEYLEQAWALLKRNFREGPHDILGVANEARLASTEGNPFGLLIDGEQVECGADETFRLAVCDVDLLATTPE